MSKRGFRCENDHDIYLDIPDKKYDKFLLLCKNMKRVCPQCKPKNVMLSPIETVESHSHHKWYTCRHSHRTKAYAFTNGMCGTEWGDDFDDHENFEATPKEAMEKIANSEIKCKVVFVNEKTGKPRICNCKLEPEDDSLITIPTSLNFKTRVRVDDVWSKYKVPEPKISNTNEYIETGKVKQTEFSRRQSARLKKIRKERQSKKMGEVLEKPTDNRYYSRKPRKPTQGEL